MSSIQDSPALDNAVTIYQFDQTGHPEITVAPERCCPLVLFDLEDVWVVDTIVLSLLLQLRQRCVAAGGRRFIVRNAPATVREAMRVMNLDRLFEIQGLSSSSRRAVG
jgi:hypothetical protein